MANDRGAFLLAHSLYTAQQRLSIAGSSPRSARNGPPTVRHQTSVTVSVNSPLASPKLDTCTTNWPDTGATNVA